MNDALKPVLLMVFVQVAYATGNLIYKLAINDGMSISVITAYRLIFGLVSSLFLALIFERKSRPPLTWRVLLMSILCGLFGYGSSTFATAIFNLVPALTFILAVLCRLEKLNMKTAAGMVKVLGTVVGIGGSMVLTFFKGAQINIWTFHVNLMHQNQNGHIVTQNADSTRKILGVVCGLGSCLSFSLWLIIQAKMSKEYSSQYSSTTLMTLMGAIQATAYALCVEKDWSQWRLGWSIRLLASVYSGIVVSGIVIIITAWCVQMRGPLFASIFNPLCLVVVAVAGSMLLDEKLYVGSVIGGVIIVGGLYMVLWGKSKETKKMNLVSPENTQEFEGIEVVNVRSTSEDHDNGDCSNNSKSINNIVTKVNDDESSKSGHQSNDIDNANVETEEKGGS
ncbi:EamA domain [Sesbania bispinosa]|nr:EamA domain [Sesbania bispinosa]